MKLLINQSKPWAIVLGLLVLISACGGEKTSEELQEAFQLHEEALKIRQQAEEKVGELVAITDSVFIQTHQADLEALQESLHEWDEQLVEVPGFEEEHDHNHEGHDHHDHNAAPELSPKEHLDIQQHLLAEIKTIAERARQIQP
ncbi:MAG TPA: hypothetical protein DCE41_08935 [Cytophagales bacterium]|nr:hypothetical protein [Cytophagales bacterium]HAA20565.1 hypothetical protein [Cytophagales bacterium]HAP65184.1 hypothetical protein [Cytophagales bacterium]